MTQHVCAQTHKYSTHRYTSSPFFSSLSSMSHPTQGQRARESAGGERGETDGGARGATQRRRGRGEIRRGDIWHQAVFFCLFVFLLTFYFNAILIRSVYLQNLFPATKRRNSHQSHTASRRLFSHYLVLKHSSSAQLYEFQKNPPNLLSFALSSAPVCSAVHISRYLLEGS